MNRREWLKCSAGFTTIAMFGRTARMLALDPAAAASWFESDSETERLAQDPRRPQFHLLPARNWMNDPNGPVYWKGHYHMFFQYNPNGAIWGDMHWAHAISPDMVHWKHLPVALSPTPDGPDAAGCFSGTAVIDHDTVAVIYTGVVQAPEESATIRDGKNSLRETQCLATSSDPELKTWTKLAAPVIGAPPPEMQVSGFRDPSPWRQGDQWYMTVGSGVRHQGGAVLLYRSQDLRHWDYLHVVASGSGSGENAANPVDSGDMWECPDLFPLGDKHVLIYSAKGKVYWQSGVLDETELRFHPEKFGVLDYGAFYAAKTQLDRNGNRILWGWVPETRPLEAYKAAGWAGLMSLPRVLSLRPDGDLALEVLPAVQMLRGHEQRLTSRAEPQQTEIEDACGEIQCSLERGAAAFTVSLLGNLAAGPMEEPILRLQFAPDSPQQVLIDGKPVPLPRAKDGAIELHIYIDGSVAELILQSSVAYTKRFYYAGALAPKIRMHVEGATIRSLSMWQIRPISPDRLTV